MNTTGRARERPARRGSAWVLAGYCLVSFLYFGVPVATHPGRVVVGSDNDPKLFIWMFAWWPHAIAHGENPIITHVIWAPSGYDLAWATSISGLALLFAPLTALAGPVVAYNAAAILLPGLAAWSAFLLCRRVTRSLWASLVGGYLYGFSSYMLGHSEGHMHLTAVFVPPLVALLLLRALRGEVTHRGLAVRLGLLLAAQISLSTEVFATLTLALVVSSALAFCLVRAFRERAGRLVGPVVAGFAIGSLLASPLLYYVLTDFISARFSPTGLFSADAVNLVVPTPTTAIGGAASANISAHFLGNELEQTAYFGVPLLLLLGAFFLERRRDPVARFLLAGFAAALIAAFGSGLNVDGHRLIALPWALVANLPVFDNLYTGRLTLYAWLVAAVAVALWIGSSKLPRLVRIAFPLLVVASLAPNLGHHLWDEKLDVPPFISGGDASRCLTPGENVLALPYGYMGSSTLWQALSGFRFRLAGGEVGNEIPAAFSDPVVTALRFDEIPAEGGVGVVAFARSKGVSTILVDPNDPVSWSSILTLAGPPKQVGGLLLYRIGATRTASPGC